ncbi:MAG: family 20 glycosylhydrolase [Bacteroidales bacterium]|nr:family 20 glycosylhydrolase [Bacteroidales bacterium]MDY0142981.1 family 20 glycosylhydrolase [Bacteroidales bacterium]
MRKRLVILMILSVSFCNNKIFADELYKYLIPFPQQIKIDTLEVCSLKSETFLKLIDKFEENNKPVNFMLFSPVYGINRIRTGFNNEKLTKGGYRLKIDENKISILAYDEAALFTAWQTLKQILAYSISEKIIIPCLMINDFPDFERRGFMLDISRDKVPTIETLYQIVDFLANWKINEFQLYTEHTFAYKNHQIVWENSSPMTAEEMQKLDEYCKKKYIDLVPNQNSFGHMENWLKHDDYLELAECPTTCQTIWGPSKKHSLDPTNPKSFELMQELYCELLPNFSSEFFNIGCDETMELGLGRSSETCRKFGKGRVYLDYLVKLNKAVNENGKTAQFWGDIIVNHPELIPELPKNMIPMVWGYDANFNAGKNLQKFKDAGFDFYVCPGTSSWNSLIGRNDNGFENLRNAAIKGKDYSAKGYLNTCWGDYGHWQPLSVSMPAIMLGAAYSWNCTSKSLENLQFLLNNYVFQDKTGNTAKAILKLGYAHKKINIPNGNANAFHLLLYRYKWTIDGFYQTKELSIEGLENAKNEIKAALNILELAEPQCNDSTIVINELKQAANLALHSVNLGIARLKAKDKAIGNIPAEVKTELYNELKPLIKNHRDLWIIRNREGGLNDSAGKLEKLLKFYQL